jgi:hypothetical protein
MYQKSFPENLKVVQLVKNSTAFYGSFPFRQAPVSGPYKEPDESSPRFLTSSKSALIISFHLCLGLQSGLSSGFYIISLYRIDTWVLHDPFVAFSLFNHRNNAGKE